MPIGKKLHSLPIQAESHSRYALLQKANSLVLQMSFCVVQSHLHGITNQLGGPLVPVLLVDTFAILAPSMSDRKAGLY